jgi:GNAT superfamily N-acetyltransferase
MAPDEADDVSALVLLSFEEFIRPEYDEQGVTEFRRYAEPAAIRQRIARDHFVMVAEADGRLAGMIEIREGNHVGLLFVSKDFHRRGVGRALLRHALAHARAATPDLARVTVNSSTLGVAAYEKLGFRQTGPERTVNGIAFIPMAMKLEEATK